MKWPWVLIALLCTPVAQAANYASRDDVRQFIDEMVARHGMDQATLAKLFSAAPRLPRVIKAIMPPSDPGIRSWQAYRARFVEPKRIAAGHRFMQAHAAKLAEAEARFGVPGEIIAAYIELNGLGQKDAEQKKNGNYFFYDDGEGGNDSDDDDL